MRVLRAICLCGGVIALVFYIAFMVTQPSFLLLLIMLAGILCLPVLAVYL
jgi:hypothetical protein